MLDLKKKTSDSPAALRVIAAFKAQWISSQFAPGEKLKITQNPAGISFMLFKREISVSHADLRPLLPGRKCCIHCIIKDLKLKVFSGSENVFLFLVAA